MEKYFENFRKDIIGIDQYIKTPFHERIKLVYTDWTASGRMYGPIEDRLRNSFFPIVANTHTETNYTGSAMTYAYHYAREIIKKHVGASDKDVLISTNSGMTGVVNKFQRILGLKIHENFKDKIHFDENEKPIVFVSHMEHHSNQTSWIETIADVVIIPPDKDGLVSLENFQLLLNKYKNRKNKIAAITSCSNVTGISTPYFKIAEMIHAQNGLCFVDFACSAPYVKINMHENDSNGQFLDAIYFSPHKFLGGPGSTGILIFNQKLYSNTIPDNPGGGTVDWTNPWGKHKYIDSIEVREDGGTPSFLQTIKAALCIQLKEEMGVENMQKREEEIIDTIWKSFSEISNLHILASQHKHRLGVISFYIDDLHYNVGVKLLNDKFGIQSRGGCSCAGTYGHYLLNVSEETSNAITCQINQGDLSLKPGWIRISIHPTHTNEEINYVIESVKQLAANFKLWEKDYDINYANGAIKPKNNSCETELHQIIEQCFTNKFNAN